MWRTFKKKMNSHQLTHKQLQDNRFVSQQPLHLATSIGNCRVTDIILEEQVIISATPGDIQEIDFGGAPQLFSRVPPRPDSEKVSFNSFNERSSETRDVSINARIEQSITHRCHFDIVSTFYKWNVDNKQVWHPANCSSWGGTKGEIRAPFFMIKNSFFRQQNEYIDLSTSAYFPLEFI